MQLYSFRAAVVLLSILLLSNLQLSHAQTHEDNWVQLFNGKNLKGWKQLNGKAKYRVEGSAIVGTTQLNTPNSFLCTEISYGDFILEFEVYVDPSLNSGVQIRSNSLKSYKNGRVHGYQVEIDPSERAFTGGIYDEGRSQWLYPLARNPKGRSAFKNGIWNSIRVEAVGNKIRTWVNGIQCANLVDDTTASGFIALQVHSIRSPHQEGKQIKWKNIKIKTDFNPQELWVTDPTVPEVSYLTNTLSPEEVRKGWRLLWDGKTTNGWIGAKLDRFPDKGWEIKDGILKVLGSGGGESTNGGDIVTTDQYSNFELIVDFKVHKAGNSGIKYFVDRDLNKGPGSAIGLEYQILDDKKHPDAKKGVKGNRTLGSLYDLIRADNLSIPGRGKPFKGVGVWNRARILVNGNHVEHWLNNEKIIEFERGSQIFRALVAYSKYKDWPGFGMLPKGNILLQDHGDEVHFRNIKIREF